MAIAAAAISVGGSLMSSQISAGASQSASNNMLAGNQQYINYLRQQGFDQETINAMLMGYAKQQGSLGTAANQAALQQIMSGMGISPYASGTTAPGPTGVNQLASGGTGPSIGGVPLYSGVTSSMGGQPGAFTTEGGFMLSGGNVLNAPNVPGGLQGALTPVGPAPITNQVASGSFMSGPSASDVQALINPEAQFMMDYQQKALEAGGLQRGDVGGSFENFLLGQQGQLAQAGLYDPAYQKALTNQTNEINRYFSLAGLNLPSVASNVASTTGQGSQLTSGMQNTAGQTAPAYQAMGNVSGQNLLNQGNIWSGSTQNIADILKKYMQSSGGGGGGYTGNANYLTGSSAYDPYNVYNQQYLGPQDM